MTQEKPILRFNDVSFRYRGGSAVLEKVNFELGPREFVSVVGPNGGGKSTLLKLILGLLVPNSGSIQLFGSFPTHGRNQVGYTPQHLLFDTAFPINVFEVVLQGCLGDLGLGFYRKRHREATERALDEVGLLDKAKHPFSDLSGGQRQRVLIARALVSDPKLLLLDEPTANIDQNVEAALYETLSKLRERMSIMIVSHDIFTVSKQVERVLCLNRFLHIHPATEVTEETVQKLFGEEHKVVRHDIHECDDHSHHHGDHTHDDHAHAAEESGSRKS